MLCNSYFQQWFWQYQSIRSFILTWVTAITPIDNHTKWLQNNQRKEQQCATAVRSHVIGLWLTNDFWQGLIGHPRGLCSRYVDATEMIGDTWVRLMDFVMTFHHATGVRLAETIDFTVIWDHISNSEQEGFRWFALYTRINIAVCITELGYN